MRKDYCPGEAKANIMQLPAYFNDAQRQAQRNLSVKSARSWSIGVLSTNQHRQCAHGLDKTDKRREKSYCLSLSGGTFRQVIYPWIGCVAVWRIVNYGDNKLGGDDFDQNHWSHMIAEFRKKMVLTYQQTKMALLKAGERKNSVKAEKAKRGLLSGCNFQLKSACHLSLLVNLDLFINDLDSLRGDDLSSWSCGAYKKFQFVKPFQMQVWACQILTGTIPSW